MIKKLVVGMKYYPCILDPGLSPRESNASERSEANLIIDERFGGPAALEG